MSRNNSAKNSHSFYYDKIIIQLTSNSWLCWHYCYHLFTHLYKYRCFKLYLGYAWKKL